MSLEKYESQHQRIERSAEQVWTVLSDFNNLTPMLEHPMVKEKVEEWHVEGDTCSFRVQGFTLSLRMVEKTPHNLIKIASGDGSPIEFIFWIQLKEAAPYDTRMRMVLHVNLNMMMKMFIGKKIQGALDSIASQVAAGFNMTR